MHEAFTCAHKGLIYLTCPCYRDEEWMLKTKRKMWAFDVEHEEWMDKPDPLHTHTDGFFEVVGDMLYLAGGRGLDTVKGQCNSAEMFSVATDQWTYISNKENIIDTLDSYREIRSCSDGNMIYIFGKEDSDFEYPRKHAILQVDLEKEELREKILIAPTQKLIMSYWIKGHSMGLVKMPRNGRNNTNYSKFIEKYVEEIGAVDSDEEDDSN